MKRYLLIIFWILLIVIVILAGYFAWQVIFRRAAEPTPPGAGDKITAPPEIPKQPSLKPISSKAAVHYWINKVSDEIYYISADGIYKISSDGREQKLDFQYNEDVRFVQPSFDGSRAIIAFGPSSQTTFTIFDPAAASYQVLPSSITSAAWDPQSNDRLVYLKEGATASNLVILTLSTKKSKELLKLTQHDLELEWVLPNFIYLKEKPSSQILGSLWAVDINKAMVKPIIKEESGLMVQWTPDGALGLKFSNVGLANQLSLIDNQNRTFWTWNLITLPSKCTLGTSRGYCAVPGNLPLRIQLPDDYLKRKINTVDDIYSINLNTGETTVVFSSKEPIDADKISFRNNKLFFVNKYDNQLYQLDLQ